MNCIRIAVCNSLECYIKMSMPLNDVICYYEDAKKKTLVIPSIFCQMIIEIGKLKSCMCCIQVHFKSRLNLAIYYQNLENQESRSISW